MWSKGTMYIFIGPYRVHVFRYTYSYMLEMKESMNMTIEWHDLRLPPGLVNNHMRNKIGKLQYAVPQGKRVLRSYQTTVLFLTRFEQIFSTACDVAGPSSLHT